MFNFLGFNENGVRRGFYKKGNNKLPTPCYFLISNFGGGGTNVSRLISYLHIFEKGDSQLLLNYYYLNTNFKKLVSFDTDILNKLHEESNIIDFLKKVRKMFILNKGRITSNYKFQETSWNPEVMLDSGSGNIFRDIIQNQKIDVKKFEEIYTAEIKKYLDFGIKHRFDMLIAMDIASKYTEKRGEHRDKFYKQHLELFKNLENNLVLLRITLQLIAKNRDIMIFAPVHGNSKTEYINYLKNIIRLEKDTNNKFDGFAIGGLGNTKRRDILDICCSLRVELNKLKDSRPIHILGVGALQNIIPLSLLGADSFDCHSPWRRASEGKFVIPLIDSNCKVITTNKKYWSYIPIEKFDSKDYVCDCSVCSKYSLNTLRELYKKGNEYTIFAKILFFKHNISQQEFLCKLVREKNIYEFIKEIPESSYKENLVEFTRKLKQTTLN